VTNDFRSPIVRGYGAHDAKERERKPHLNYYELREVSGRREHQAVGLFVKFSSGHSVRRTQRRTQ